MKLRNLKIIGMHFFTVNNFKLSAYIITIRADFVFYYSCFNDFVMRTEVVKLLALSTD